MLFGGGGWVTRQDSWGNVPAACASRQASTSSFSMFNPQRSQSVKGRPHHAEWIHCLCESLTKPLITITDDLFGAQLAQLLRPVEILPVTSLVASTSCSHLFTNRTHDRKPRRWLNPHQHCTSHSSHLEGTVEGGRKEEKEEERPNLRFGDAFLDYFDRRLCHSASPAGHHAFAFSQKYFSSKYFDGLKLPTCAGPGAI